MKLTKLTKLAKTLLTTTTAATLIGSSLMGAAFSEFTCTLTSSTISVVGVNLPKDAIDLMNKEMSYIYTEGNYNSFETVARKTGKLLAEFDLTGAKYTSTPRGGLVMKEHNGNVLVMNYTDDGTETVLVNITSSGITNIFNCK